jgi:eukaryotic-like serine/threonine-protein kinase
MSEEQTLFQEAMARSLEERAAFLDQACAGKPQLRTVVEALLAAHEKTGHSQDKSPVDPTQTIDAESGGTPFASTSELLSQPGDAIGALGTQAYVPAVESGAVIAGRYTLQNKIGEGGMGKSGSRSKPSRSNARWRSSSSRRA